MTRMAWPSGEQWWIRSGEDELVVVEVGGGPRTWNRGGIPVLAGYREDEMCTSGRGQQLMPWPNRIRDGRWSFRGVERQLPITEVEHHNASHGLLRWMPWHLVDRDDATVTVGARLHPQPGWAWTLDCETTYALSPGGLQVTQCATNISDDPAPFGFGAHPYLAIGDEPVEDVEVSIPAATYVAVDDRLLPTGTLPVAGTPFDFRTQAPVGDQRLDTAFTDLLAEGDGVWRVRVSTPGRAPWTVWGEASAFPWVQVFTGKAEAGQPGEHGVAVEPMTCPADAFNSGDGLIVLEPGETWTGRWGISPS